MPACPTIDAPGAPIKGAQLFTLPKRHYGADINPCSNMWPLGDCFRINRVNGRSFYWRASRAQAGRRLLVEWSQWVSELQRTRHVWFLEPEPSTVGWRFVRPLQPDAPAMNSYPEIIDRFERDQRFQRAVKQVSKHYQLERHDEDGAVRVEVAGGSRPYEVRVTLDWSDPPACTCPDAIHRRPLHGGFCKHTVAVLMRWPDLRCQLLSAIL